MSLLTTIALTGKSGTSYKFNVYPITEECPSESGIYFFGNFNKIANTISIIYIGKAESFQSRFYNHHKDECVKNNGGNVICLMQVKNESERTKIEDDLLKAYPTKCNEVNNSITPK